MCIQRVQYNIPHKFNITKFPYDQHKIKINLRDDTLNNQYQLNWLDTEGKEFTGTQFKLLSEWELINGTFSKHFHHHDK